ncbi:hypothetical protein QR680_015886 [Steinernema hermaphroditum]|uniref:G-protein coupled receptors family 1 profile domain-containing protein n=1 Tax=Steinernema hermaphroditum TaxID=289476 RepID=A0AA39H9B0_9BILA|nr:hypothetical protein QR680_015886 [Steinernema hermaphroditum]
MYIIVKKSPSQLGVYKYVMLNISFWVFMSDIAVDTIIIPTPAPTRTIALYLAGLGSLFSPIGETVCCALSIFCVAQCFASLCIAFFFRYQSLCPNFRLFGWQPDTMHYRYAAAATVVLLPGTMFAIAIYGALRKENFNKMVLAEDSELASVLANSLLFGPEKEGIMAIGGSLSTYIILVVTFMVTCIVSIMKQLRALRPSMSGYSRYEMIPDFNPTTASTITISVGTLGVLANILALYAIRRNSAFSNAFGTLCQSHAVANIGVCAAFSVLTGGVTLLHPTWHSTYWGRRSGQLIFFFWEGSLFTHLFAAIDRATVINFPSRYSRIFGGGTVTKVILLVVWAIATAQSFPYFITSCSMTFDVTRFTYHHGEGLCGHITEHYTDFAVSFTTVIIIWMLDMSSLFRLIQLRENAPFRQTKRRHEIQLFFQVYGIIFTITTVVFP